MEAKTMGTTICNQNFGNSNTTPVNNIFLEKNGYDSVMLGFMKSIDRMDDNQKILSAYNMDAESSCPDVLNAKLNFVNENIESNYLWMIDTLVNTYNSLDEFEKNMEHVDEGASKEISVLG